VLEDFLASDARPSTTPSTVQVIRPPIHLVWRSRDRTALGCLIVTALCYGAWEQRLHASPSTTYQIPGVPRVQTEHLQMGYTDLLNQTSQLRLWNMNFDAEYRGNGLDNVFVQPAQHQPMTFNESLQPVQLPSVARGLGANDYIQSALPQESSTRALTEYEPNSILII
jgi:hypothetical protein